MYGLAGSSSAIPTVITGGAGISSPVALVMSGGDQVKSGWEAAAKAAEVAFQIAQVVQDVHELIEEIGRAEKEAERKRKEAERDRDRLEKQISGANLSVEIAKLEKQKIDKGVEHAEQVEAYMRDRFTNLELYNWRVSQLSTLYFQTYQMAYDLAKRAEKAFRYELGATDSNYIRFGYWDSLKKGLLAGEQLYFDLRRMEKAYLDQNRRGYEITKHVSLQADYLDRLNELKTSKTCYIELEEELFDRDYPGHYMRRFKSVSLSIDYDCGPLPPHTNVNCTLTLLKNSVRMKNALNSNYARNDKDPDTRFRDEVGAVQSIVTSSGQDDSGLFVLDFDDERYLPFEGAGAISSWKIELLEPNDQTLSLSDVVLHIMYTAREGGAALKEAAQQACKDKTETEQLNRRQS